MQFKSSNLSPSIMSELFMLQETNYDLRTAINLQSNKPRTTTYGIDSVLHLAPKITFLLKLESLITLKNLINTWTPKSCPCRL